jgi:serine/threonine-protein kinase
MTDLLGPGTSRAEEDRTAVVGAPGADDERVTEIGAPELVDRSEHPLATTLGVLALLLVVLAGVVGVGRLIDADDGEQEVAELVVPRLGGRSLESAQQQLERLGLVVDVRYEPNESTPVDVVVEQEPIAGARLEVGEQVVLVVSDGPLGVRVPDLGEVTGPEAVRLLSAYGLTGVTEGVYDEDVPQQQLVATVPAAGSRAAPGSEVRVLVSRGPEPRTVPDVLGRTSADAFVELGRAELQVGGVRYREDPDGMPGTVLSVDPEPGERVARDFPVEIVVVAEPGASTAPDLVGFTQSNASRIADELGFDVSVRTETVTGGDRRAGRVISQSPVANSPLPPGGDVRITVAVVPVPSTTTTSSPERSSTTEPDD